MKMTFLRLIIWNIFKSIGEENALSEGKNCVTKSRLTTYANILNQNNILPCFCPRQKLINVNKTLTKQNPTLNKMMTRDSSIY